MPICGAYSFLNDVDRIAARDYEPSDNDIVRARLRTLGVQEYNIKFEIGERIVLPARVARIAPQASFSSPICVLQAPRQAPSGSCTMWVDPGHRCVACRLPLLFSPHDAFWQRPAWFPYFDDCDAIIFLAPISCFDERLAEDRKVNRLEDSYMLWRLVCASKLLQNTQMILFLNKYDLLDQKLRRGVKVKDHVRSYGDRPNDVETVSKCACWLSLVWVVWVGVLMMAATQTFRSTLGRS